MKINQEKRKKRGLFLRKKWNKMKRKKIDHKEHTSIKLKWKERNERVFRKIRMTIKRKGRKKREYEWFPGKKRGKKMKKKKWTKRPYRIKEKKKLRKNESERVFWGEKWKEYEK